MQTRKVLAVLAAVGTVAALMTGCSSSKSSVSTGPLPDASTLVKESAATTKKMTSVHLALSVTGQVKGVPVKTLTGDLTTDPATAAKGHTRLTVGGEEAEADFVVIDGDLYVALTPDNWWPMGKAADVYDVSTILNPDAGLANVLAHFTDAKAEGRENIDGTEAVKVTGTVSAEAVNKIAEKIGATEPVPSTAWIREDGDHELVQAALEITPGNTIEMTLSDWNKPVTVTKPEGV